MSTTYYMLRRPITDIWIKYNMDKTVIINFKGNGLQGHMVVSVDILDQTLYEFFASYLVAAIRYGNTVDVKQNAKYVISEYGELLLMDDLILK